MLPFEVIQNVFISTKTTVQQVFDRQTDRQADRQTDRQTDCWEYERLLSAHSIFGH